MWFVCGCFFVPHVSEFESFPFSRVWFVDPSHCGGVAGVRVGVVDHPAGGWFFAHSPRDPGLVFRGGSLVEAVRFLVLFAGFKVCF